MTHPNEQFDDDRLFGKTAEECLRDHLCEAGALVSKFNNCNKNDFQLVYNNKTHRVEIKNEDRQAQKKTGNVCVEMMQRDWSSPGKKKASGLAASEASIFVHTLAGECLLYRAASMRDYLRSRYAEAKENASHRRFGAIRYIPFGDNGNEGFILPIRDVFDKPWCDHCATYRIAYSDLWAE